MEPPVRVSIQENLHFHCYSSVTEAFIIILLIAGTQTSKSLHLRGSGKDMNNDDKHHKVPYRGSIRFNWSGLPCIDFREKVLLLLENGFGSMLVNGATLLQAVRQTDPCGVFGNPARALAPPRIAYEIGGRVRKAFSCMMNYTAPIFMVLHICDRHMPITLSSSIMPVSVSCKSKSAVIATNPAVATVSEPLTRSTLFL